MRVKRGESWWSRAIPADLLALWREEAELEAGRGGRRGPVQDREQLWNDELWDHQWYLQVFSQQISI